MSHPVVGHAIGCENFNDTKQMNFIIQAVMRHFQETNYSIEYIGSQSESSENERPQPLPEEAQTEGVKMKDEDKENEEVYLKQTVEEVVQATRNANDEPSEAVRDVERTLYGLDVGVSPEDDGGTTVETDDRKSLKMMDLR